MVSLSILVTSIKETVYFAGKNKRECFNRVRNRYLSDNVVANLQKQIDALSSGKLDSTSKASGLDVINTTKDNVYMTPKSMEVMCPKGTIGLFTTETTTTRPYLGTKWQRCNGSLIPGYGVVAQQIDPLFSRLYHRFGPRLSGNTYSYLYGDMDTVYNPSDGNFYWLYYSSGLKCRKLSSDTLGNEQTLKADFSSLDSSIIGIQYIGCAIHSTTGFCVAVAVNKGSSSKSKWYLWILTPSTPNNLLSSTWNYIELSTNLFYVYNSSIGSHSNVCVAGDYYFVPVSLSGSQILLVSKDRTNWGHISFGSLNSSGYSNPDGVVVDQDGYVTCVVQSAAYNNQTCYRLRWTTAQLNTIISNPDTLYSASDYLTETIGAMPTTYGGGHVKPRLRKTGSYYFLNWDNTIRVYSSLARMTSPTAIKTWSGGRGICAYDVIYMHGYYILVFFDCSTDGRQTGDRSRYAVFSSFATGSFLGNAGLLMENDSSTVEYNMYGCYMAKLPHNLNPNNLSWTYLNMGKTKGTYLGFSLPIGHRIPYLPSPESGLEYLWFAGNWSGAS